MRALATAALASAKTEVGGPAVSPASTIAATSRNRDVGGEKQDTRTEFIGQLLASFGSAA